MRTGGDDIAQALALIGVRPTWDSGEPAGHRLRDPAASVLGRPRVDVTLRVSGFFRDAFPAQIELFDSAARAVAALDEAADDNPLARAARRARAAASPTASARRQRQRRAGFRVFGSKPGAYGAGLQALIDEKRLGDAAPIWPRPISPGAAMPMATARKARRRGGLFERAARRQSRRWCRTRTTASTTCSTPTTITSSRAAWRRRSSTLVGRAAGDLPQRPFAARDARSSARWRRRSRRVVRGRVVNPKWIAGVMRHGYKGAFEMAATVDYLFAFAATTGAVARPSFRRWSTTPSSATTRCATSSPSTIRRALREMADALPGGDRARAVAAALQRRASASRAIWRGGQGHDRPA